MKPEPQSVLAWLRQLSSAKLVELTPRTVLDVEALLRLPHLAEDPATLGAALASLLAHDEVSWRQIDESFARFGGAGEPSRPVVVDDGRAVASERERKPAPSPPSAEPVEPARTWWPRWVAEVRAWLQVDAWGWRQWVLLLSVIVVLGVQGTLLAVRVIEHVEQPSPGAKVEPAVATPSVVELEPPPIVKPPEVVFQPVVAPVEHHAADHEVVDRIDASAPGSTWAAAALLLGSLLLAGLATRWWTSIAAYEEDLRAIEQEAKQDRRQALREVVRLGTPYHVQVVPPLASQLIEDAATLLARLTAPRPGWELDAEPTIARTIEAGGRVSPVYKPECQRSPLLVLVDVEAGDHPDLYRVERLLARWQRGGLQLVRYDFAFRPVVLTSCPHGAQATLGELFAHYEDAPVLVISRFMRPEDYGRQLDWLDPLSRWPNRAWLDLDPRTLGERPKEARANRVAIEASGLPRFPFTEGGLLACARTLKARGEHAAPLREKPLASIGQIDVALRRWAACACVVPDPIWPQLDAMRRSLPELLAELPDARYVHRLIEWLQINGEELDPDDPRVPARAARLGQGDRLVFSSGQRQQLGAWLRDKDRRRRGPGPGLEEQARRLILEQLRAADVEGDPFEAKKRALKIDLHEAVLDPSKAKALLGKWGHTAMAGELRAFLVDEREVQKLDQWGTRWSSGVWDAFEAWAGNGEGRWARPMDVLRPRPWTLARRRLVLGVTVAVVGSYVGWWIVERERGLGEVERKVIVRGEVVRVPATWEVKRPGELSEEDAVLRRPCEDVVALAGVAPMKLRCVVGGSFLMGSPETEEGHEADEEPVHTAKVASFDIGETEVTQGQWKAVMGTEPFDCDYGCGDEYPAQEVSWNDAVEFMNGLTEKENEARPADQQLSLCYAREGNSWAWSNKSCTGYRLPTEAEWEYAARAGRQSAYSFGDDATVLGEHAWYSSNSDGKAHRVGEKKANGWGLYDMHGNVWEWVGDWYAEKYPSEATSTAWGGPDSGEYRVLRGGSFFSIPQVLRSAGRVRFRPAISGWSGGFRCVRVL